MLNKKLYEEIAVKLGYQDIADALQRNFHRFSKEKQELMLQLGIFNENNK